MQEQDNKAPEEPFRMYVNLVGTVDVRGLSVSLMDILALGAIDADTFSLYITGHGSWAYAFKSKDRNLCPKDGRECEHTWTGDIPRCCHEPDGDPEPSCEKPGVIMLSPKGPIFILDDTEEGAAERIAKLQQVVIVRTSPIRTYGRRQVTELNPDYVEDPE